MSNRREIEGVTVLEPLALIILKAVAWLDLTVKKERGDSHAYGKDISKHKNDIARIVATIPVRDYALPEAIKAKMREFMVLYADAEIEKRMEAACEKDGLKVDGTSRVAELAA